MNNIKLSVLQSGERIIAKTSEATREIEGGPRFIGYVLEDPQLVEFQDSETLMEESENSSVSIVLRPWIDLTKDKQFLVPPIQIVTMCDPIEEVYNIYVEKVGGESENA